MTERRRVGEVESSSSSDNEEEGEMQTLITQNGTTPTTPNPRPFSPSRVRSHRNSTFEIEDHSRIRRGFFSNRKKILVVALCVPAVVVLVYFFGDLRGLSLSSLQQSASGFESSPNERMREAELRSLNLLRNQQLGLLLLWNRTFASSSVPPPPIQNSNFSSNSSSSVDVSGKKSDLSPTNPVISIEDFRSALLKHINMNKEIQEVLLSTHRGQNASSHGLDGNNDLSFMDLGADVCRKRDWPMEKKTIEWKPKMNRYLFAICLSGQMTNHLICLEKHMFFAALLNRVLILPSYKFDYQYDRVIDVNHINDCFGRKVVIPFEEFESMKKNKIRIDKFICYIADPPCYVDEEHAKKLRGLGLSLAMLEAAWPEDAKSLKQKKRVVGDITSRFACEDEVLAIGDTFYADVEEDWLMQPGGPLSHKCKTAIQPNQLITQTAERFIQTFLGKNYIALHFRRHGFLKFCNAKEESCFFPIPQAAECILRVAEKANAPVIYLSTDAAESETSLLQSLVVLNEKPIPLIKRPSHTSLEKWDALLYRHHLMGDNQVEAMLDKTICAKSAVFIGSSGSTFTEDILRLRKDWGSASVCDEYMCQDQQPNFIASQE